MRTFVIAVSFVAFVLMIASAWAMHKVRTDLTTHGALLAADQALWDASELKIAVHDSAWGQCEQVMREAADILPKLRTQVGVVLFNAGVNEGIVSGCPVATDALSTPAMEAAFDTAAYPWPWWSPRMMALLGLNVEEHTTKLRATIGESRRVAECIASTVQGLRDADASVDRMAILAATRKCDHRIAQLADG